MGASEEAHHDAFWVITIVGGLSITKALEESTPKLSSIPPNHEGAVILLRLLVYLFIAIRLFIGSSAFFNEVHFNDGHAKRFPHRSYLIDFGSTVVHFSILYAMAVQIPIGAASARFNWQEGFFITLCLVLLYDWAWVFASHAHDNKGIVTSWAVANTATLVPCLIAFILLECAVVRRLTFELLLLISIVLLGLPDMIRLNQGQLPPLHRPLFTSPPKLPPKT
jgi:hypothetical protein